MDEHFTTMVIDERDELAKRVDRLVLFREGTVYPSLPDGERKRIDLQERYMLGYLGTLNDRISEFW